MTRTNLNTLILAGLAVALFIAFGWVHSTYAADGEATPEPSPVTDEYAVISEFWWDFYGQNWSELKDSEWLEYEADARGLFEDAQGPVCRMVTGVMAEAIVLLNAQSESQWYAGSTLAGEMSNLLNACWYEAN